MGPGESATKEDCDLAYELGKTLAMENYIVLSGGRNCGVMDAAMKGAKDGGGRTIGILPGNNKSGMSRYVDIPIITGMGNARNIINVLTSEVVVAIGESLGTSSEIALALKVKKPVLALNTSGETSNFYKRLAKPKFIQLDRFIKAEFILLLNKLVTET